MPGYGSYYTYPDVGRIAGEAAVFYSQGPAVVDRSTTLSNSNRKVRKEKKSCEIPGRDIEQNLRIPGTICAQVIGPQQSPPVHQQSHRSSTYSGVEGRGSGAVG